MFAWVKKLFRETEKAPPPAIPDATAIDAPRHAELTQQCIDLKKNGDAYFELGQLNAAAACYRQAIDCNPDYAEAHNNLSNACREQ